MIKKYLIFLISLIFIINISSGIIFQENFNNGTYYSFDYCVADLNYIHTDKNISMQWYYAPNSYCSKTLSENLNDFTFTLYLNTSSTINNGSYQDRFYFYNSTTYYYVLVVIDNSSYLGTGNTIWIRYAYTNGTYNNYYNYSYDLNNYKSGNWIKVKVDKINNTLNIYANEIFLFSYMMNEMSSSLQDINYFEMHGDKARSRALLDDISLDYYILSINKKIYGYTTFKEINNSEYILPYTKVCLDNSNCIQSNDIGYYEYLNQNSGSHILKFNKSDAFSIDTHTFNYNNSSNDYEYNSTLLYSKPSITNVNVKDNYIYGTYSNNFKTLLLWENPNYVWCSYYINEYINTTNDKYYYKKAIYEGNNIFSCENINKEGYSFTFNYSDIYNYNLNIYHPYLIGIRNFSTNKIFINKSSSVNNIKSISGLSAADRELYLKNNITDIIFYSLLIFLLMFSMSVLTKKR